MGHTQAVAAEPGLLVAEEAVAEEPVIVETDIRLYQEAEEAVVAMAAEVVVLAGKSPPMPE